MKTSLSPDSLGKYVTKQIQSFYPDDFALEFSDPVYKRAMNLALERTEECFKHVALRGYSDAGEAMFNHMHSDQYSQFLYFLMNSLWKVTESGAAASRVMNLNRALSGMFVSFKCELPEHFVFGHPVGTVLGNAQYGDGLVVLQGVTVNTGNDAHQELGATPVLGKGLFLGAGAKIIGQEPVGDRVSIGAGATVFNEAIPNDSVVVNQDGVNVVRPRKGTSCHAETYFDLAF